VKKRIIKSPGITPGFWVGGELLDKALDSSGLLHGLRRAGAVSGCVRHTFENKPFAIMLAGAIPCSRRAVNGGAQIPFVLAQLV
jgi:hypothetical protein